MKIQYLTVTDHLDPFNYVVRLSSVDYCILCCLVGSVFCKLFQPALFIFFCLLLLIQQDQSILKSAISHRMTTKLYVEVTYVERCK